jgi:site-specific DNA-cytosine methylase
MARIDLEKLFEEAPKASKRPLMIDLFAGIGGASESFVNAGWEVVRVELDPVLLARAKPGPSVTDIAADLTQWSWEGRRPNLIWASPPCTEFSRESMPWCRTGREPSMELVRAARRIVREANPDFWVIENVRGAIKWFRRDGMGDWQQSHGPVFLWGEFPSFSAKVKPWKEKLPSTAKALRSKIPFEVSEGLRLAVEHELSRQMDMFGGGRR